MIFEDRDPTFWAAVANHPEVAPHVTFGKEFNVGNLVGHPTVTALRSAHGGFLFIQLDGIGRVFELHTMFTPGGWGREVSQSAKEAFDLMFAKGAQVITTYEVANWWRSRPPRSFRFQPAGDFAPAPELGVSLKTWVLTRDAWTSSPAGRRFACL